MIGYQRAVRRGQYVRAIRLLELREQLVTVASWTLWMIAAAMVTYFITQLLP